MVSCVVLDVEEGVVELVAGVGSVTVCVCYNIDKYKCIIRSK